MHYRDLRGWLDGVESFGELRVVGPLPHPDDQLVTDVPDGVVVGVEALDDVRCLDTGIGDRVEAGVVG